MADDLNKLREVIQQNRAEGNLAPKSPERTVAVDRYGDVKMDVIDGTAEELSVVHQGTFAR